MNIFDRYPRIILSGLIGIGLIFSLISAELLARAFGLGEVVVYEVNPLYGYRPGPDQTVRRNKTTVYLNNLALRADASWDVADRQKTRVLFLGDSITYGGSYIDNSQLFSTLSTKAIDGITVGNAGVNGWGVSNVAAHVVDAHFTPANIYISTFPEEDFERGLNRVSGSPFWPYKPHYALTELWQYFLYKLSLKKFDQIDYPLSAEQRYLVKKKAVEDLLRMDRYLKQLGFEHKIYITPTKRQAMKIDHYDQELYQLFDDAKLDITYLTDWLQFNDSIDHYYHDAAHLSAPGHALWATVYANHLADMI